MSAVASHTGQRRLSLQAAIEIDAPVDRVSELWCDYEALPRRLESVRRTLRVDAQRVLWDVDVAGRQLVWEARIVESLPDKLVRWESCWGVGNCGEVRFEALPDERTRLVVEIDYAPRGLLERVGGRCGLVALAVRRDLEAFRRSLARSDAAARRASGSRPDGTA